MTKPNKQNDIILLSNRLLNEKPQFTLFESRIFYSFLYRQDRNADEFSEIRIPINEFYSEWKVKGNKIHEKIEMCVKDMPEDLFSKLCYIKERGILVGKFSDYLKEDILKQKKNFTKLYFSDITKLSSDIRHRLYELMCEYKGIGNRWFAADDLILLIADKTTYKKNHAEFERRVLNPAVEQLNKNTHIFVNIKKEGYGKTRCYTFFIAELDNEDICEAVLNYFNERAKTNYKYSEENVKNIKKRIEDGYELEDFKVGIDNKLSDWEDDEKMSKYIRPQTLFGDKFESYLNQKNAGLMAPDDPDYLSYMEYFARGADY